jgi:hypothetical protein
MTELKRIVSRKKRKKTESAAALIPDTNPITRSAPNAGRTQKSPLHVDEAGFFADEAGLG